MCREWGKDIEMPNENEEPLLDDGDINELCVFVFCAFLILYYFCHEARCLLKLLSSHDRF